MGVWRILMIVKNLYILIDYVGHPTMNEEYLNKRRLDTLNGIVHDKRLIDNTVIVPIGSTNLHKTNWKYYNKYYEMYREILSFTSDKRNVSCIEADDNITVSNLIQLLKENNYYVYPDITQIHIGGTNLLGCILNKKPTSVTKLVKFGGFKVNIVLPMCAEGEVAALNDIETIMKSTCYLYQYLKAHNLIDNVNLTYRSL